MPQNNIPIPDFEAMVKALFTGLSQEVAEHAQNFFKSSFDNGGFTNYSLVEWPRRRSFAFSHKLMMQSNRLRDSIEITEATPDRVSIEAGKGLPYAAIHNTGGIITITVTEKMRKYFWYEFKKTGVEQWKWMALTKKTQIKVPIPQRKFIGESHTLNKQLDEIIAKKLHTELQNIKFT